MCVVRIPFAYWPCNLAEVEIRFFLLLLVVQSDAIGCYSV